MRVKINEVSKSYGITRALDGVDLDLNKEISVLSMIGPSGGGKSTLLKILGGLEVPDCGAVSMNGREVYYQSSTVAMALHAVSLPPPHPAEEEKLQANLPSTSSHFLTATVSHHFFIFHAIEPRLVGEPIAIPSHQVKSDAVASSQFLILTSIFGTEEAPSDTNAAIFSVLPVLLWYKTSIFPIW